MEEVFLNNRTINSLKNETDNLPASFFGSIRDNNLQFLLKHNSKPILKLLEFMQSKNKVFLLKGYSGSGKSEILDFLLKSAVSEDILVFKFLWQAGTNLDDVLLSIYKDFTIFSAKKKVILPKSDTIIFSEKINSYIKHCYKPMLFVFDYFEINFLSQKKQDEFCDFIKYLTKFSNIKIVIASRAMNPKDIKLDKFVNITTLQPLNESETRDFLKQNKAELTEETYNSLYEESGGQYIFLSMFISLSEILETDPQELFEEFKNKKMIFSDFLIQKNLKLLSDKFLNLFYLLSIMRLGVSENFILAKKIASKEDLEYLLKRKIITQEFGLFYLKDYFKSKYLQSISADIREKIYTEIINFFETMLPKKPFERDILISRITMRKEIEAYRDSISLIKIEKKKSKQQVKTDFSYLSYTTQNSQEWQNNTTAYNPTNIPNIQKKEPQKFGRANLSKEDVNILHLISQKDIIETELTNIVNMSHALTSHSAQQKEKESEIQEQNNPDNFEELINQAEEKENAFKYREAIELYEKALSKTQNPLFEAKLPMLTFKAALCHRHIKETDKAIQLFKKASELYSKTNSEKSISALLCIAQSYSEVYRFDEAKNEYNKLLALKKILPKDIFIRINLDLAEIEDNNVNTLSAAGYAYNAVGCAETTKDIPLLAESYFKYALYNDDLGNYSTALKYYLKCTQISQNIEENAFLSPAYSNLAILAFEKSDLQNAITYHEKAIEIDEKLKNTEGLYFSYIKLAEIYKNNNYTKCYDYLIKALKVIRKSEDKTHLITVYIELGDCYFKTGKIRKSIKAYMIANKLINEYSKFEELYTLKGKMNLLKNSIGQASYDKYLSELKTDES